MKRKSFIKSVALTGAFIAINPWKFFNSFYEEIEFELPFIGGEMRRVSIVKPRENMIDELNAQQWNPQRQRPNYNNFAPTQYYNYQQAQAYYQQELIRQQQYYAWINQQRMQEWQHMMANYNSNFNQFGQPIIKPEVKSMYSYVSNGGYPTLVGLNRFEERVEIEDSLLGGIGAYKLIQNRLGDKKAQTATAPQSDEDYGVIDLTHLGIPNLMKEFDATSFKTKEGQINVSDKNDFKSGNYTGNLVEVEYIKGKEYLIV